jgi:hypothetical protein
MPEERLENTVEYVLLSPELEA